MLFLKVPKPERPHADWAHMIKHSQMACCSLKARELFIVAYDVSRTSALVVQMDWAPSRYDFYITFDDFLTVAKCRHAWTHRDDSRFRKMA